MRQAIRRLFIISLLLIISLPNLALANEEVMIDSSDNTPKVFQYFGEFDTNIKEEIISNDSSVILYKGTTFQETGKDYTYLLWEAAAHFTSSVKASNVTIQLRDGNYDDGYLQIFIDSKYIGEVNSKGLGSKYIHITNLSYMKHRVILKQRGGPVKFAWIGFGDKKGDINPPSTRLSYSPELINGLGEQDTELSFYTEDDINEDIEPSGIAKTLYSIDGSNWLEYQGPFTLLKGKHQISYYSIDNNKNMEKIKTSSLFVSSNSSEIAYNE